MMHATDIAAEECSKYEEMWAVPEYKDVSYGLENVERFMDIVKPPPGSSIIDIGCGSGRAMVQFERLGLRTWGIDITPAGLETAIDRQRFIEAPLWAMWCDGAAGDHGYFWDYGYCCDVLEHIPPEYTMLVVDRCLQGCGVLWLQIANVPDNFGHVIGKPLHLTVMPFDWWRDRIATIGTITDARDLCGHSLFVVTR